MEYQACSARSLKLYMCGEIASPAKRMKVPGRRSFISKYRLGTDMQFRYVLSNRFLFILVEKPPADMAALLHAFEYTPPVVKRRAKELLDVIRDAMKKGLSSAVEDPKELLPTTSTEEAIIAPSKMDVDVPLASTQPLHTSLWSFNKALPVAATSSLFGSAIQPSRTQSLYSSPSSSLFGSLPLSGPPKVNFASRFQDVVNKIHSTLVVAPTV
jgi:exosome complex exonuclease RRP6